MIEIYQLVHHIQVLWCWCLGEWIALCGGRKDYSKLLNQAEWCIFTVLKPSWREGMDGSGRKHGLGEGWIHVLRNKQTTVYAVELSISIEGRKGYEEEEEKWDCSTRLGRNIFF